MTEKRRCGRVRLGVYLNKFVAGVPYMVWADNISAEGMRLANLIEPEHGNRRVGLQFQLPGNSEVIYAEGEIVRQVSGQTQGSGIRFTLITDRQRQLIRSYVAHRAN